VLLAASDLGPELFVVMIVLVTVFVVGTAMLAFFVRQYRRCPPNRILVVYGKAGVGEPAVCIHGGARLVVPLVQHYGWLRLEPMRIKVSRQTTASGKTIADPLPRVFSVAIGTTAELMQTAAVRLLGLTDGEITRQVEDIIVTRLDILIDAIEHGQVETGTDEFYQRLETSISAELEKLGLVLINFRRE
jgi:flotillin